jgi:hypothetical protein
MDLVSTPTWHSKFYGDELGTNALTTEANQHILISGTADYSILAYVLHSSLPHVANPQITVLDLCETPLNLCQWYAARQGAKISTLTQSIFELEPLPVYDLITADAFLTRFTPDDRRKVIQTWYNALLPEGKVVTTTRIERDKPDSGTFHSSISQVEAFTRRAAQLAKIWQEFVRIDPKEIEDQARVYAERMVSWSFGNAAEVRDLFTAAGFRVARFDLVDVKGEMKPTTYAQISAYKEL